MRVHLVLAECQTTDQFGAEKRLSLIKIDDSHVLEIGAGNARYQVHLEETGFTELMAAIQRTLPSLSRTRVKAESLTFEDGTIVLTQDNRGDPFREGLDITLRAGKLDWWNEPAPSLFLEDRDLLDFIRQAEQPAG